MNPLNTIESGTQSALTDRHQRRHTYLRVSVTDRCQFRCRYCIPELKAQFKPHGELLSDDEIVRVLRVLARRGVTKVRFTGGEPMLRRGLVEIVDRVHRDFPEIELAMTTNGVLFAGAAQSLRSAGLNSVNISIDSLKADRFREMTQTGSLEPVLKAIEAAREVGFPSIKLNVVVMRGVNDDELVPFVQFARQKEVQVRFIEFMPFLENNWAPEYVMPYAEMRSAIEREFSLLPVGCDPHAVGKDFALEGSRGSVSFVSSMTDSFCAGCNRLRLTADGRVKSCLFLPAGIDVKSLMRSGGSDDEVAAAFEKGLEGKWAAHPEPDILKKMAERRMIDIGG